MEIQERHHAAGKSFELPIDADNKLVLVMRNDEAPSFAIGWKLDGQWYYQSLMWSCRGGKRFWYRPLIAFYRHIRRHKLTDYSLRFMAWAENRLRHGGYAVGTYTHQRYIAVGQRLAASRQREAALATALQSKISQLPYGSHWSLEELHNNVYVIQKLSPAIGSRTCAITVRLVSTSIIIQESAGISVCAGDRDPFRTMRARKDGKTVHVVDDDMSHEKLVVAALWHVAAIMVRHLCNDADMELEAA